MFQLLPLMPSSMKIILPVDTDLKQREIKHVFLGKAANLRPDLANNK
jgi:chorismate mutase